MAKSDRANATSSKALLIARVLAYADGDWGDPVGARGIAL